MMDITTLLFWNVMITLVIMPIIHSIRSNATETKRIDILVNKTREEVASKYVTKEEFTSAVEEIKAMIEDKMGNKEEMKEEVIEDTKEELSAVAPSPVKHNPEAEADNKVNFKISENRIKTTSAYYRKCYISNE